MDVTYIKKKIELAKQGVPVKLLEEELMTYESLLRGSRGWDLLIAQVYQDEIKRGNRRAKRNLKAELINAGAIDLELREIDDVREMLHERELAMT